MGLLFSVWSVACCSCLIVVLGCFALVVLALIAYCLLLFIVRVLVHCRVVVNNCLLWDFIEKC